MAKIELIDVSLMYDAPTQDPVDRLLKIEKDRMREDLPTKAGKGVVALDHVNLKIPNGRTFVVVGPSGCGKSTLLRVIAGLNKEYSGKVLYDGQDVQTIEPKDREIGMVFQGYALYPNFNSRGNLSFFFQVNKVPDEETRARIQYTSELMGIGFNELLPRKIGTLSGGEKQRVAIARAIVRAPRLLLLDEPLSNLDAKLRVQTRSEIKRLLQRSSITTLYVTHDQVEAIALADQIVIMHRCRIDQVGTYQEIMDNPLNSFVAGFLGLPPMSLLAGGSVSGDKLILGEYQIPLPARVSRLVREDQPVTLGMRQEVVAISAEAGSIKRIELPAEVESFEHDYVHRTQTVQLRTGLWTYLALSSLDMNIQIGQRVHARLDSERLYFFDTKSGLRI